MNFEFSDEQELLREQARGFLGEHCPPSAVRAVLDSEADHDSDLWRKVSEMGWTATVIPEEFGGLGLSYLELVVIAEEMGRSAAPLPFSSSVYLATEALLANGSTAQKEKWLPLLASGEAIGTLAFAEGEGRPSPKSLKTTVTDGKLSGRKLPVPDGRAADFAVVVASSDQGDGATLYLVDLQQDGVSRVAVRTLDFTRGHAVIEFANVDAEPLGGAGAGWAALNQLLDRAAVLFAWEQVGIAESALYQARDYAMGRYAFGRAIASYQAIKHKLAEMYVKNTLARSNCYYGAWALNTNSAELPLAAATARVGGIQAALYAAEENIQTHGGMGFTWEFDCQFYYRRAKLLSVNIGSEGFWQDRLITAIEQNNAA
ncbi:MAG TPA: acyl-CoA dehydrogenase [Gammaproteobacteria bacterium]|nr:acyl-CoA dehydrogenase [Gammaproteobacteria bacterium]|tara:strand:+ start:17759 stop:18877 length:1119 start_codon:yes stop_codon:yes gene_type:complete